MLISPGNLNFPSTAHSKYYYKYIQIIYNYGFGFYQWFHTLPAYGCTLGDQLVHNSFSNS